MIRIISKEKCCGCHSCYNACPNDSITMKQDNEGFWYPVVDVSSCIDCGLCEKVCPEINIAIADFKPKAYASINKDDVIRYDSSSGGIFTLLAEYVISRGGVVFGAGFDDNFDVCHQEITNQKDLALLRGSKYVQSKINDSYKIVKERLVSCKFVLFTGTPCQVNGLKTFLNKEYENLICMDIICHGVPSPLVWTKYVEHRKMVDGGIIKKISFRLKDEGWKLFAVLFEYSNKTAYRKNLTQDMYMKGFLTNLYLRPSCYNCSFKTENRVSDFTLADFWGIQEFFPSMDDDKGVSLVIVHSEKAVRIFKAISNKMICHPAELDAAIRYNPSMLTSVPVNKKRDMFFEELSKGGNLEALIDKYTKISIIKRSCGFIKHVFRHVMRR